MKSRKQRDRLSSLPESLIIEILSFLPSIEAVKTSVLSKQWRFVWKQRDRLSSLPDSLIIGILSFLPSIDAVKTSVLSKQWRFMWKELPKIEFKERSSKSVDIVNRLIAVGGRYGHLKTFSVEFDYQKHFASDVNAWIEFAAANKVENLSLCLHSAEPAEERFRPPPSLGWRCLRSLSLGGVMFASQQHLENLLSRCPVLETLELIQCKGFHHVDVGNRSFRRLRVVSSRGLGSSYLREISGEHMRELEVSTNTPLRVSNAPSLYQASINISNYFQDNGYYNHLVFDNVDELQHIGLLNMFKLFEDIRHVNKLELSGNSIHVISEMAMRQDIEFPQFMRLQNLKICAANRHIYGIEALLRSSPNLEKLLISCLETAENAANEMDKWDKFLLRIFVDEWDELLHVKFVDMAFTGSTTLVLAKTILKKAPVLEQMVIRNASSARNSCEALLRYPKSSGGAKLCIHQ